MASHNGIGSVQKIRFKTRLAIAMLLSFVLVLICARLALPYVLKSYVNQELNEIPGYYGHVDKIHVALWRGAYEIVGVQLLKKQGRAEEPFFAAERVSISVDWSALLQRRLLTSVVLQSPQLRFVQRKTEASSQTSVDESWQKKVYKLIPFDINRFTIYNGYVGYEDKTSEPKINLYFQNVSLRAENISNATRMNSPLPSNVDLQALLLASGLTTLNAKVNFLSEPIDADLKTSIRNLDIRKINNFANAYGRFDFKSGRFQMAMELAASKTQYKGYVKTLLQKVDVLEWKKERQAGRTVPHLVWEGLVGAIIDIFKNHGRDQFAARIPISGSRDKMNFGKWAAVGSILRNAFVKALSLQFEDSVKFSDLTHAPTPKH